MFALVLPAQTGKALHEFDDRIDRFNEAGQNDSFLYYANQKLQRLRQADSLALWAWGRYRMQKIYEPAQALRHIDETLRQAWRSPQTEEEWEPFLWLQVRRSRYLLDLGSIWQSVQAYETTRQLAEQHPYPDFEAVEYVYKPLGNNYTRLGDNEKALAVFQKALPLALAADDRDGLAGLYHNIGITLWNQGNFGASEAIYRQGLDLANISKQKQALLLEGFACTQLDEGHAQQSLQNAKAALRLLPPDELAQRASTRLIAGVAATRLGQFDAAERFLLGALADARRAQTAPRQIGKIEIARADLYRLRGQAEAALLAANRALSALLPGFKARNLDDNPVATAFYEENTLFEALQSKAAAALAFYQQSRDLHWLQLALACHDLAYQAETRLREVFQYNSSKMSLQNASRQREQAAMDVARLLYEKTGDPAYARQAFAIAERSKAALLREALLQNLAQRQTTGTDPRLAQLAALKRSLVYFEKNLLLEPQSEQAPQWQQERDGLLAQISALERSIPKSAVPATTPALADFGRYETLAADETLVEYFVGLHTVDVFVLTAGQSPVWQRLPYDQDLKDLTQQLMAYFRTSGAMLDEPAGYLHTAFTFWQKMLPPEAARTTRLLVVPDGFLHFIPFEALVTASPGASTSLRNAPYLLRRQTVGYAWSWATLQRQNDWHSTAGDYLLGVAPQFAGGERGLSPLGQGESEWQGFQSRELLGQQATTAAFSAVAGQYRIVHCSTHAFAEPSSGLPARLELYDQPVLLPELYALSLNADLVVLSACQTGLGEEEKGEGVMSLARAFGQSGAACVISSLWTVNDRSTTRLFADFYRNLHQGQSIGTALRSAKLHYLGDPAVGATLQSPYFWAGFVAVGADRIVAEESHRRRVGIWCLLGIGCSLAGWWFWKFGKKPGDEIP
ncbi:MAG: CHAT domain-containing tetratricopeptide repeat protein [Saprospiraceae bacterium]